MNARLNLDGAGCLLRGPRTINKIGRAKGGLTGCTPEKGEEDTLRRNILTTYLFVLAYLFKVHNP